MSTWSMVKPILLSFLQWESDVQQDNACLHYVCTKQCTRGLIILQLIQLPNLSFQEKLIRQNNAQLALLTSVAVKRYRQMYFKIAFTIYKITCLRGKTLLMPNENIQHINIGFEQGLDSSFFGTYALADPQIEPFTIIRSYLFFIYLFNQVYTETFTALQFYFPSVYIY